MWDTVPERFTVWSVGLQQGCGVKGRRYPGCTEKEGRRKLSCPCFWMNLGVDLRFSVSQPKQRVWCSTTPCWAIPLLGISLPSSGRFVCCRDFPGQRGWPGLLPCPFTNEAGENESMGRCVPADL